MAPAQYPLSLPAYAAGAATSLLPIENSAAPPCMPPPLHQVISPQPPTIIENVQIWDGEDSLTRRSVAIEGRVISFSENIDRSTAKVYNGEGTFLMPGLIDSHVHASQKIQLEILAQYGITTAFDMGSYPSSLMPQWRDVGDFGLTSLTYSGAAAISPFEGSCFPGAYLPEFPNDVSIIDTDDSAYNYVRTRINDGVDHLKILIEANGTGPDIKLQQDIKNEGEKAGLPLVSHAADYNSHVTAREVGGKFITHVPTDEALTEGDASIMKYLHQVAIPTLIMERSLTAAFHAPQNYSFSKESVTAMHKRRVPILAGTDTNGYFVVPGTVNDLVPFGTSMHDELFLLNQSGLWNDDVLRAATSRPAKYFNLKDRGRIQPGMRADLLLLKASPLDNINNTREILQAWTAGTPINGTEDMRHRG